jgi:YbbR domain-containing protein
MFEWASKDWWLKGLALVIAFALWVTITGEDRALTDLSLPLEIELPDGLILSSPPPTAVTVRLQGSRTAIRKLDPVGLTARIDLRDVQPGPRDVQLTEGHLSGLPRQMKVAFFIPERVQLTVDRRLRRELPVEVDLLGAPPAGYTLYHAIVQPAAVLVEGPESDVSALARIRTDPVRIDHRTRPFTVSVGAVPERPRVRVVDPQPLEVRVIVDEAETEAAFPRVPVVVPQQAAGGTILPAEVTVVVSGAPSVLERLSPAQIRAVADLRGMALGSQPRHVPVEAGVIDLPEDQLWRVKVKSITPSTVAATRRESRSGRP